METAFHRQNTDMKILTIKPVSSPPLCQRTRSITSVAQQIPVQEVTTSW